MPYCNFIFLFWLLIEITLQVKFKSTPCAIAGVCCAAGIFSMWKLNLLNTLFTGRLLSYLGTISYTLYLIHPDIGWKVISLGKLVIGEELSPWHSGLLLLLGVLASIIVAHIFNLAFEKPTQKIAARLKSESFVFVLRSIFTPNKSKDKVEMERPA
jgi:peptidoglycan/LPS O-acetylase OafA/YrhL|tara:strand:+ start:304 stop:771 length:468 start_codon:yes stop_codon:yes gene_type:complete